MAEVSHHGAHTAPGAARRSAPRPLGSTLAVSESGELAGSVSGGCVEGYVFGQAREVLAGQEPRLLQYGISDELAFSVGLPCGGDIEVFANANDAKKRADRIRKQDERQYRAGTVLVRLAGNIDGALADKFRDAVATLEKAV